MLPRTMVTMRTMRCESVTRSPVTGMKSITSATPSALMNRVIRIGVPGR